MPVEAALEGFYDHRLVALSILIAILSSYAALDLGGRVTASRGHLRLIWLLGGSAAMGVGIWSMHYIGMLAYSLPVPVSYDWPMVLVSLLAAMLASAVALFVVSRNKMGLVDIGAGGLLMGSGIAVMHYVGMEAMRLPAMCHYSPRLVALSVALAVVIALVALWLTFHLRGETESMGWRKLGSACLMGSAIPVMHYTGMAAVTFTPMAVAVDLSHAVEISSLGIAGIGGATLMVLALTILTSLVDRRFSAQALELQKSEQRYRQLTDSVQVILWRSDTDCERLSYINKEAEDLLGYSIGNWTGTASFWINHLHPEDRELAMSCCRAASEGPEPQRFEHRMLAADGTFVWLRSSVRVVTGESGSTELVGVMTDITERKRAQEAAESASAVKSGLLSEIKRLNGQLEQENARMSGELEVTKRLQQMILPRGEDMSNIASLDISGLMEPAAEVGGDYYDVVARDGSVFFGIGDVTGHGLESGVLAIMVQTAVRTLLASGQYESRKFFDTLNRVIFNNARRMNCDRNLTLSLLHYHDSLVTISGQHEEVLVIRDNGDLERHDTIDLGFHLGLVEDISELIGEITVPLESGDVMIAYTDGITEAMDRDGVSFGIERLAEAVRTSHTKTAGAIREDVLARIHEYVGGQRLLDDISLLVIKPA